MRFIIKYCNITDSVYLIDTLKRMPLTMIINKVLYVHGLDCNDYETAKERQSYYENLCGYQRTLFQTVTSFELKTGKWLGNKEYGFHYDVFDNTGRHVIGSFDKSIVMEWLEWLKSELQSDNITTNITM